jgi:hypothetical protein
MRTGAGAARTTTAAAPSEIGQQWYRRSGSATSRLSRTVSSVTVSWKCANGFLAPFAWFLTATSEISRSVPPVRAIHARVTTPARAGIVAP